MNEFVLVLDILAKNKVFFVVLGYISLQVE